MDAWPLSSTIFTASGNSSSSCFPFPCAPEAAPDTLSSSNALSCTGGTDCVSPKKSITRSTSSSETKAACARTALFAPFAWKSISPLPSSFSAPLSSMMTRESTAEETMNAMREGMFALINPVIMSVDGRCVATIRWIPDARPSWAMRQMDSSTSLEATIIRSASSSITITIRGRYSSSSTREL